MNQPQVVHVAQALGELCKDVAGAVFVHPELSVLLLQAVVEKVTPRRKLCNDVHLACHGELLDQTHDVLAVCAEFHGVGFGDSILFLKASVLLDIDRLDGDLGAGELVLADHYGVAAALADLVRNCVLLKLVPESLCSEDRLENLLALLASLEEEHARLLRGEHDLDGVPGRRFFRLLLLVSGGLAGLLGRQLCMHGGEGQARLD